MYGYPLIDQTYHPYKRIYGFKVVKWAEGYCHAKINENFGEIVRAGYILEKAPPWDAVFSGTSSSS
jgi:hypothetical protein